MLNSKHQELSDHTSQKKYWVMNTAFKTVDEWNPGRIFTPGLCNSFEHASLLQERHCHPTCPRSSWSDESETTFHQRRRLSGR